MKISCYRRMNLCFQDQVLITNFNKIVNFETVENKSFFIFGWTNWTSSEWRAVILMESYVLMQIRKTLSTSVHFGTFSISRRQIRFFLVDVDQFFDENISVGKSFQSRRMTFFTSANGFSIWTLRVSKSMSVSREIVSFQLTSWQSLVIWPITFWEKNIRHNVSRNYTIL